MSDTAPTITISSPKALSESDWKSIMGSSLHESMMRNRCVINIKAIVDYKKLLKQITDWLSENCNSFYYVEISPLKVYIERDADAALFVLAHNGQDAPINDQQSSSTNPPKTRSSRSTPTLPPLTASEIMEMIKERKQYHETWEDVIYDIRRGLYDYDLLMPKPPTSTSSKSIQKTVLNDFKDLASDKDLKVLIKK